MNRTVGYFVVLSICLVLIVPAVTSAPFVSLPKQSTWDSDMINVEQVTQTGAGVYVAVLDTGLSANWKDYFPVDRIATDLGKGFVETAKLDPKTGTLVESGIVHETGFIGTTGSTHGTHVVSTIIGYNYYSPADTAQFPLLQPIFVNGIAPNVTIIPVKVISDYHIGGVHDVFGTNRAVAAGILYATELKLQGYEPMVITMSLGGPDPSLVIEDAINYAISKGVIVVAAAGNEGEAGMSYPGAYPQVISVGACGWEYEWYGPGVTAPPPRYRLWWLQDSTYGYNDVPDPLSALQVYITNFSSRQGTDQDLDVVAPGSWVRGPYPGYPGYNHLPWWSSGNPNSFLYGGSFLYVAGTSQATPHVTGVVAMMLQKNPTLTQSQVEIILEGSVLPIAPGSMTIWDLDPTEGWYTYEWGSNATGAGLVQADLALANTP